MSAYSASILAQPSVVLYGRFGEAAGPNAIDSTGGTNGTYNGGVTFAQTGALVTDPTATSVKLNGTTGFVSFPNQAKFQVADGPFTICLWLKQVTTGVNRFLANLGGGGTGLGMLLNATNNLVLRVDLGADIVASSTALTDTTKFHFLAVQKNAAALAKVFIDGVDVSAAVTNQTINAGGTSAFEWGRDADGTKFNDGFFQEGAVFNSVLSPGVILTLFQLGMGTLASGGYPFWMKRR